MPAARPAGPVPAPGGDQCRPQRRPDRDALALDGYHLFHAIRADLLRRLGREAEAARAYEAAIALTENEAERGFLQRNRGELGVV